MAKAVVRRMKKNPYFTNVAVPEPQKPPRKPWTADEMVFVFTVLFALTAFSLIVIRKMRKSYRYDPTKKYL